MKLTLAVLSALACAACTTSGAGQGAGAPTSPTPSTSGASTHPTSSTPPPHSPSSTSTSAPAGAAPSGGPVPAKFVPVSTTWISSDDGWALGTAPCSQRPCTSIVRTQDGGQTWQGIPAPRAVESNVHMARRGAVSVLRFANDHDGWAGATGLYSTHDGGATWTQQSIAGAVGHIETGGGYVYVTTDSCPQPDQGCTSQVYASPIRIDSWHAITPRLATQAGLTSLVVSGGDWFAGSGPGVFHGSGASYAGRLPDPCPRVDGPYGSPGLAVADAQHLDAVCVSTGAMGSAQYRLYGTVDGGHTWHPAGKPFMSESGFEGVADNAQGVLLIAASSAISGMTRTTNDGQSFGSAHVHAAPGGIPWADLGFTTATRAVVVLDDRALYLSDDAGRTFRRVRF